AYAQGQDRDGVSHCVDCICNGSGRVPREVGLEELIEFDAGLVTKALRDEYFRPYGGKDQRERFLLAALRAMIKALMR
ncbi:hypothetical protein LCGC14_1167740, partial [marine sediment metagenome]